MNLRESIRRILRENDYSPAGKEVIPNSIVVHKSNPMFREEILKNGLKVKTGECYKIYVGYGTKCKPAIFATNSTNKRAWFDSTYDDDIWEINTEMIPDVKWYKDRHYESRSKHIVTFQDIPKEVITLKYKGTGSGDHRIWSKDSPNLYESVQENIKILKSIAKKIANKLHCDRQGSCVHFAEIFVEEINEQYPELLNDFDVIEGYVNVKFGDGIPQEHTWIKLNNGDIIDPTFSQFDKYDKNAQYSKKRTKVYSGQEYYDEGKEGSWFSERRKKLPSSVFKEEKRETIRRILREEAESRMVNVIQDSIDKVGITSTILIFGGFKVFKDYLDKLTFTYKDKIDFIKYVLNELGGLSLRELGWQPIPYSNNGDEYKEIVYLGTQRVIVYVWGGHNYETDQGEFGVHYYNLNDDILDDIFYKLLTVANENDLI